MKKSKVQFNSYILLSVMGVPTRQTYISVLAPLERPAHFASARGQKNEINAPAPSQAVHALLVLNYSLSTFRRMLYLLRAVAVAVAVVVAVGCHPCLLQGSRLAPAPPKGRL